MAQGADHGRPHGPAGLWGTAVAWDDAAPPTGASTRRMPAIGVRSSMAVPHLRFSSLRHHFGHRRVIAGVPIWCEKQITNLGKRKHGAAIRHAQRNAIVGRFQWTTRRTWSRRPDRGQGGVDARGSQSPFRGHLARTRRMQGQVPVREALLRARRHGEPDQGIGNRTYRGLSVMPSRKPAGRR